MLRRLAAAATIAIFLFVLIAAATVWIVVHAIDASTKLDDVRHDVAKVRADLLNGSDATADLAQTQRDARAANHDTHDPVWFLASWLPPVKTVRGLSSVADDLAQHALPPVVTVGSTVTPAKLRVARNQIALAPLQRAAPDLAAADVATARARDRVARLPNGWIGIIGDARAKVLDQLTSLAGSVDTAARFAKIGPDMLGAQGRRRYFVGIENNAEARATGGLVAAYAIVTADNGRIKVVERGNDGRLRDAAAPVTDLGKEYDASYGPLKPTQTWITSNVSPHFPDAANIWAHLWQAQSGERIDGAFGVDPYALGAVVGATGPVSVRTYPHAFTAASLPDFIESGEYAVFRGADQTPRKDFVSKVAGATLHNLLSGAGQPRAIATALGQSAGNGHLALWSARPQEQAVIAGTPLAGELPVTRAPFASLSINDEDGSKLSYYIERSLTYRAATCAGPTRDATVTVTLRNAAPPHGLPAYVRQASTDQHTNYVERVPREALAAYLDVSNGAGLTSATINGKQLLVTPNVERGHLVYEVELTLDPGVPVTMVFHLNEPIPTGSPQTKVQPMARPQRTVLDVPNCRA